MTDEEMAILKKMLRDTYLEVANMNLETKYIGDTQSLACSKFRQKMEEKLKGQFKYGKSKKKI